jgi:hypothetical protein
LAIKEEWTGAPGESFDYRGSIDLWYLPNWNRLGGFPSSILLGGIALMAVGLLAALTFVLFEKKVKDPILDISLLRYNKVFSFSSLAAPYSLQCHFCISYLFSLYLQYIKGFDPAQGGLILIAQP